MERDLGAHHRPANAGPVPHVALDQVAAQRLQVVHAARRADEAAHARAALAEQTSEVRAYEARAARQEGIHSFGLAHPRKFQAAIRAMSFGLPRRPRTADASNPECIAQFWHRSSLRGSQYAQFVRSQKSFQSGQYFSPMR